MPYVLDKLYNLLQKIANSVCIVLIVNVTKNIVAHSNFESLNKSIIVVSSCMKI